MKEENLNGLIKYSKEYESLIEQFLIRTPVSEFKNIDAKRIKSQFTLLQSGFCEGEGSFCMENRHKNKNRYSDILVYNHNRVKLEHVNDFYINASLMKSVINDKVFAIFSQAPLPKTFEHFWQACYHYNVTKIIMLCSFQDPKKGPQAERYWPQLQQATKYQKANLIVKCQKQQNLTNQYRKTTISTIGPHGQRRIQHDHWTGWNDMKKPVGENNEILFKKLVDDCIEMIDNNQLIVLHCSAGVGRTGTLGTMIQAIRCARSTKQLSVFQIVDNMRRNRLGCVQTLDQYCFIYQQLQKLAEFK